MPTIEISKKDLEKLTGQKFSQKELEDALLFVKGEIDKTEGDKLVVDIKETNRPDLWGTEGIAQELCARLGKEKGLPKLALQPSKVKIIVDPRTKNIRPAVAAAVVNNIKITEDLLLSLISLQEKISMTFGRKRKEAAIGVYELNKITPPIHYKAFAPKEIKFRPLDYKAEMDLEEILTEHPKGKEYSSLIKEHKKYPVWIDSKGIVCSLSPIINSETTGRVNEKTTDVFIEVSGHKQETVNIALLVMAQAFSMRGGTVKTVTVQYNNRTIVTPDTKIKKTEISLEYINKIAGMKFSQKQALQLLERARYNAKKNGNKIQLEYPPYRQDILHQADVVEDILISHGFNNVPVKKVEMNVIGEELPKTLFVEKARDACVGLGLQEILTFTLTSKEKQLEKTGLKEELVEIANPISSNWAVFRKNMFPESLEFLNKNKHNQFPQKIFETGKTVELCASSETKVKENDTLCICLSDKDANYSMVKSALDTISNYLGLKYSLSELDHPSFEKGKSAKIEISGKKGFMGEINQKTLQAFGLDTKTAVLEIEL